MQKLKSAKFLRSLLFKQCPYCFEETLLFSLRRVPSTKVLRWNETTPRTKLACPKCGGLVLINKKILIFPLFICGMALLVSALWIPLSKFLQFLLGLGVFAFIVLGAKLDRDQRND